MSSIVFSRSRTTHRASRLIGACVALPLLVSACSAPADEASADSGENINEEARDLVPEEIREAGRITVAINPDGPPIKYLNEENEMDGVVIDLVDESASRLGLEAEFAQTTFDGLIPGVIAERFDMIGSIGDYAERHEQLDMIDYMVKGASIVVRDGDSTRISGPDDLCGLSVAFVRGTYAGELTEQTSDSCVENGHEAITLVPLDGTAATELALQSEQVDAEWGDSPDLQYRTETKPGLYEVVHFEEVGPYGIGFPKDTTLTDAFRMALLDMADDGTFEEIMSDWGLADSQWDDFPINQGPEQS